MVGSLVLERLYEWIPAIAGFKRFSLLDAEAVAQLEITRQCGHHL